MGNSQTKAERFINAAASGDADYVHQCMQNETEGRERLLSATTGLLSGRKTVLHLAARRGSAEVIASVLGPLVDAVTAEIVDGLYPGKAAEILGKTANQQDSQGRTPLLTACHYGHWDCVELLLEAGSNVFACDKDGNGVLHLAAINGHTHVVQQLLEKAQAQAVTGRLVSALNLSGFTPLHYAAWAGNADMSQQLLTAGVDQLQPNWGEYDRWLVLPPGSTPLHVAAGQHHSGVCLVLLQHYALEMREWLPGDPAPVDPRSRPNNKGELPVQVAVWRGLTPGSQLALCLQPSVNILSIFSTQQLDEMRRRGPPALRVIAAAAVRSSLLQQLTVVQEQQVLQQRLLQELQQQQRRKQQERQKAASSSSSGHDWQRWWSRSSIDEQPSATAAAATAVVGNGHNNSNDSVSHGQTAARLSINTASASRGNGSSRYQYADGLHSNYSSSSSSSGQQHHADLLYGLHRTPSITLGAVHYAKSTAAGCGDNVEQLALETADGASGIVGSSSSSSSTRQQQQQQEKYCSNPQGQAAGEPGSTISAFRQYIRMLAPAGDQLMTTAAVSSVGSATTAAATTPAGANAGQNVAGVNNVTDAFKRSSSGQLEQASSITLGYLDRIWSYTEEQRQQVQQHDNSKETMQPAAAAAAANGAARSHHAFVEIEVVDATAASQQQGHEMTPTVAAHLAEAAGSSSSSSSSNSSSEIDSTAGTASAAGTDAYQHINEQIHKATGSTKDFALVNARQPSPQQQQQKPRSLQTTSITLAELNGNSRTNSRGQTAAADCEFAGSSSNCSNQAGSVKGPCTPPQVVSNAGIKAKDWEKVITPLSWKLYQQQQLEAAPKQVAHQQRQQKTQQLLPQANRHEHNTSYMGQNKAAGGGQYNSTVAPPSCTASSSDCRASSTSTASLSARRAAMLPNFGRSHHRRSFELPGASGMSAAFGASRQHVTRMLREAGSVDPASFYRTLSRTNSTLAVATSLAGALPGCVSEKLVQFVDVNNSISPSGTGLVSSAGTARSSVDLGASSRSGSDEVCAICADRNPTVGIAGCGHMLCFECTRCIVGEGVGCRPPLCPFCRRNITGFESGTDANALSASRA